MGVLFDRDENGKFKHKLRMSPQSKWMLSSKQKAKVIEGGPGQPALDSSHPLSVRPRRKKKEQT